MSSEIDWDERFNRWVDTQYIPARLAMPGFLNAQRYKNADRENYLTVFELHDAAALESEPYTTIDDHPNTETRWMLANATGFARYDCDAISELQRNDAPGDPLDAPLLYAVFFSVPDDRADEFNDWYDQENVPTLLACEDWMMCRRFVIPDGEPQPWTHLALHYLADISALESPQRDAARNTEWRGKLATEPWFQGSFLLFERLGERIASDENT